MYLCTRVCEDFVLTPNPSESPTEIPTITPSIVPSIAPSVAPSITPITQPGAVDAGPSFTQKQLILILAVFFALILLFIGLIIQQRYGIQSLRERVEKIVEAQEAYGDYRLVSDKRLKITSNDL